MATGTCRRRFGCVVALGLLAGATVVAQSGGSAPRTSWGAPDLQGIWDFRTLTPVERPVELAGKAVLTEEEAADFVSRDGERLAAFRALLGDRNVGGDAWPAGLPPGLGEDRRSSQIVDPPDGRLPAFRPGAQFTGLQPVARPVRVPIVLTPALNGPEDLGLFERCILAYGAPLVPLVPFGNYVTVLQIVQAPGVVALVTEAVHETRIVPIDSSGPIDEPRDASAIRQYLGSSRGHWEGDTLVVDTTSFNDKVGSFRKVNESYGTGETLQLTERFTRLDHDTVRYEYTVRDPETFTRPFSGQLLFQPADGALYEYACHEGNASLLHTLSGARAAD